MKKIAFYLTAFLTVAQFPIHGSEDPSMETCCMPCQPCNRADRWTNVYVGVEGGFNWIVGHEVEGYIPSAEMGYCVGGLVGYQFPKGVSVEAEIAYRNNAINYVDFFGLHIGADHHVWNVSYMGNVLYEIPYWCWKPFVGAGLGYSTQHAIATDFALPTDKDFDNFTYQLFVGFDYNVWRGLDIGLEYKYLTVLHSSLDNHALMADIKWYW